MNVISINNYVDFHEITPQSTTEEFVVVLDVALKEDEIVNIYFDDYEVNQNFVNYSSDRLSFVVQGKKYFYEAIGKVKVTFFVVGVNRNFLLFEGVFNIENTKFKREDVENMLEYVFNGNHTNHPFFSKMSNKVKAVDLCLGDIVIENVDKIKDFSFFLKKCSEFFVDMLNSCHKNSEQISSRVYSVKQIIKKPYNLNLVNKNSDICINGLNYSFKGKVNSDFIKCYNLPENVIIVNFITYLKNMVHQSLSKKIFDDNDSVKSYNKNFNEVLTTFTKKCMLEKLKIAYENLDFIEQFFINVLGVKPSNVNLRSFRSNSFYDSIYSFMDDVEKTLKISDTAEKEKYVRMESCDKIYEYYCLYSFLNYFSAKSFEFKEIFSDGDCFVFCFWLKSGGVLNLHFNDKVKNFNSAKQNLLVDMFHCPGSSRTYKPDFVFYFLSEDEAELKNIFILDSKYSKKETVNAERMEDICQKYFLNLSVLIDGYNIKDKIVNISALYPSDNEDVTSYKNYGIKNSNPSFLMLGTPLSKNGYSGLFFDEWFKIKF